MEDTWHNDHDYFEDHNVMVYLIFERRKDNYETTVKIVASYKGLSKGCYNIITDYKSYTFPSDNLKIVCGKE